VPGFDASMTTYADILTYSFLCNFSILCRPSRCVTSIAHPNIENFKKKQLFVSGNLAGRLMQVVDFPCRFKVGAYTLTQLSGPADVCSLSLSQVRSLSARNSWQQSQRHTVALLFPFSEEGTILSCNVPETPSHISWNATMLTSRRFNPLIVFRLSLITRRSSSNRLL